MCWQLCETPRWTNCGASSGSAGGSCATGTRRSRFIPTALEEKVLMRETMAAVRRAIAELPEKEQQVLRLKVLENRTDAEIAAETGLSPGSIRQYLHRARSRLREKLF